jgi:hypothetical protein
MAGIFGILESSAMQWYQDVAPTQGFLFHRHIYSLCRTVTQRRWHQTKLSKPIKKGKKNGVILKNSCVPRHRTVGLPKISSTRKWGRSQLTLIGLSFSRWNSELLRAYRLRRLVDDLSSSGERSWRSKKHQKRTIPLQFRRAARVVRMLRVFRRTWQRTAASGNRGDTPARHAGCWVRAERRACWCNACRRLRRSSNSGTRLEGATKGTKMTKTSAKGKDEKTEQVEFYNNKTILDARICLLSWGLNRSNWT